MRRTDAHAQTSAIAILCRLLGHGKERMSPTLARHILRIGFTEEDKARMHELAVRNQEGKLLGKERDELFAYANAGCLLGILHSEARKAHAIPR